MPQPLTPESDLPTADVAAGSGRDLDDLERRLAAFDSATKRLSKTIDTVETKAGDSSRPSSGNRRAVVGTPVANDDISALRPAISAASATTGALTARRRSEGGQVTPGFTSAHGKPAIPVMPAAPAPPADSPAGGQSIQAPRSRRHLLVAALVAGAALVLGFAYLSRVFRELPDAYVWAAVQPLPAPVSGMVAALAVRAGAQIGAGETIARIVPTGSESAVEVTSPALRLVSRLLATSGTRIAAGETLCELSDPASLRVVLPMSATDQVMTGNRVRVRLLGENRLVYGTVISVHGRGEMSSLPVPPSTVAHAIIVVDPGPGQPVLGQGARVLPMGEDGTGRRLLLWLRELLP